MPEPVNIAMCGLGQWGPNLLRNLRQHPEVRVVALCDARPERLAEFRDLHPEADLLADVHEVASRSDVQAVAVATPAALHPYHVRLLLESGKDVLVEKPLAMTLEKAQELNALAEERGRVLMVGHTFLYNPAVLRVKKELQAGTLGNLHLIQAQRMSLGQVRSDCNALWNLAPHDISILLFWLEAMPLSVAAYGIAFHEGHAQEDIALCVLEFPGRVVASVQVSWMNPVKVRAMTLVGQRKMLVYDDVDRETPLTLFDRAIEEVPAADPAGSFEKYQLQIRRGEASALEVEPVEPLAAEVAHFVECCRGRFTPRSGGLEPLRVVSVLEALDVSIKSGGARTTPEPVE